MKDHSVVTFSVFQRNPMTEEIYETGNKTFVVFEDESPIQKAEEKLMEVYKWSKGFHYDHVKVVNQQIVKSNKSENKMAKKSENQATSQEVFLVEEELGSKMILPTVPKVWVSGGVTFSKDLVLKEVDSVKKIVIGKITKDDTVESLQEKKKIYEELKDKKNRFVKTRTATKKMRDNAAAKLEACKKEFTSVSSEIGEAAMLGQQHCEDQMKIYEDWEAEQARLEQEQIENRVKERSQQLTNIKGVINFESGHWTFPYASHIIIEKDQLENEFGWDEIFNEANEAYQSHIKAEEAEKAKNQGMAEALYNARVMLLDMMGGYEKSLSGGYVKNGHTLTDDQITNTPDAEWKSLIQSHNTPKQQESSFGGGFSGGSFGGGFANKTHEVTGTQEPVSHPFAQFENSNQAPVQETIEEPKVSDKPFTVWDEPFVGKAMANTTILVGLQENRELMIKEAGSRTIVYNENLDKSNLCYIIFKNA